MTDSNQPFPCGPCLLSNQGVGLGLALSHDRSSTTQRWQLRGKGKSAGITDGESAGQDGKRASGGEFLRAGQSLGFPCGLE